MLTRKFFSRIWRVNAIIILLAGLLATGLLCVAGFSLIASLTRTRHVDNVATTALGEAKESSAELGSFEAIAGSTVLRAPLTVRHSGALGSSYESGTTRNYLYFDPSTRSTHWLCPSMDGVVLSSTALPADDYGAPKSNTMVAVHVVVNKDSNNDERLTDSDSKQIAVSAPDGTGYRVVVAQADRLNKALMLSPTRLLILYSMGSKLAAVELDASNLAAAATTYEIPIAP
jgi:hypothetical protein